MIAAATVAAAGWRGVGGAGSPQPVDPTASATARAPATTASDRGASVRPRRRGRGCRDVVHHQKVWPRRRRGSVPDGPRRGALAVSAGGGSPHRRRVRTLRRLSPDGRRSTARPAAPCRRARTQHAVRGRVRSAEPEPRVDLATVAVRWTSGAVAIARSIASAAVVALSATQRTRAPGSPTGARPEPSCVARASRNLRAAREPGRGIARRPVASSPPALAGRERGAARAVGVVHAEMKAFGMRPGNAADGRPRSGDIADARIRLPGATIGRCANRIRGVAGRQLRPLMVGLIVQQAVEPNAGPGERPWSRATPGLGVALPAPRVAPIHSCPARKRPRPTRPRQRPRPLTTTPPRLRAARCRACRPNRRRVLHEQWASGASVPRLTPPRSLLHSAHSSRRGEPRRSCPAPWACSTVRIAAPSPSS